MIVFPDKRPSSLIHRLDPRVRLAIAFAFAAVVCTSTRPLVLCLALFVAFTLLPLSKTSPKTACRKLIPLNLFVLLLALSIPLMIPGPSVIRLGPLAWSSTGLAKAGIIALRANSIMLSLAALVATMGPAQLSTAMRGLGCPAKLAHIFLFMLRYVELFHREYHRLRNAMRLRGFRPRCNRHTLRTFGYLIGLLFLRSIDRSDRILDAMKCRGFQGRFPALAPPALQLADMAFAAIATTGLVVMSWLEWSA